MLKIILGVLATVLIINATTFFIAFCMRYSVKATRLRTVRPATGDEVMNYFVAGMLNQAESAFGFIVDDLSGGITYANFRNDGWSAEATADAIINDIRKHNYTKVRIFTISVGDQAARYLESYCSDNQEKFQLEVVAINPCPSELVLNEKARRLANLGEPLLDAGCILTGWLSIAPMPFLATPGGNYSLLLLVSQVAHITSYTAPSYTTHTLGVVISEQDEFLDRDALLSYFDWVPSVTIPNCKHGDTIGNGKAYRQAVLEILAQSKF